MDFFELLAFLLLLATGALWYSSLNVRELAVSEAKAVCAAEGMLLLDDTVAILRLGFARDGNGVLQLRRVYSFEYSDTGNDRSSGSIIMLGNQVLVIHLNPPPRNPALPGLAGAKSPTGESLPSRWEGRLTGPYLN